MPSCLPPRYRLLDLVFALCGTVAFLTDLCIDVWSAVRYYQGGERVLGGLHFGLYVFSSVVLQILSWGWFWVDQRNWAPIDGRPANGHAEENGMKSAEENGMKSAEDYGMKSAEEKMQPGADCLLQQDTHKAAIQDAGTAQPATPENEAYPAFLSQFHTSQVWLWPSCLSVLHILQLGYPFRCLHSLEVGVAAYRSSESSSKFRFYQEYAYFLTHDISMMRLVETFLENTPQLILVLYNIIQRQTIRFFQCFSIAFSFICISWAILDYHQSLRMFLTDKKQLNICSSSLYFLWNFCLISARIMCITLFTATFHWLIALHFIGVCLAFFIWGCLQKTEFMRNKYLEPFFRATVAIILYFSWFNIADGRTIYRCTIYHLFITTDCALLLLSWKFLRFPSSLDRYESLIICIAVLLTVLGLVLRLLYYKCAHPNVTKETKPSHDETDGMMNAAYRMFAPTEMEKPWKRNARMAYLAHTIY